MNSVEQFVSKTKKFLNVMKILKDIKSGPDQRYAQRLILVIRRFGDKIAPLTSSVIYDDSVRKFINDISNISESNVDVAGINIGVAFEHFHENSDAPIACKVFDMFCEMFI